MGSTTELLNLYKFLHPANASTLSRQQQALWNLSTPAPLHPADPVISSFGWYMAAELVIAFLSTFGNTLVCAAVGLNRKLRTVTNYFLVSLAVADIAVGVFAVPCTILTEIGLPRHNVYLCLFMLGVLITLTQSSVFSLVAVAVERYVAIFLPLRYQTLLSPRNAMLLIMGAWILGLLIGFVPMMGWRSPPPKSGYCFFGEVVELTYMVYLFFMVCMLLPVVAMFTIYVKIFIMVRKQIRQVTSEQIRGSEGQAKAASLQREMKTARSLFLVVFLFTVCWLPLNMLSLVVLYCPTCPVHYQLILFTLLLSHINSVVNPFLYAFTMTPFRDAFKAILLWRWTFDKGVTSCKAGGRGTAAKKIHQT